MPVVSFFFKYVLSDDALSFNNIPLEEFHVEPFILFDRPTICNTVEYIDQSDNSSWRALVFDS